MPNHNPTGKGGFKPGQSGNPGGRPKALHSLRAEARRHTLEAVRVLLKLMRTATSEGVRLGAAEAILDRGWGRPISAIQVDAGLLNKKLNELTPEEIVALEDRIAFLDAEQGLLDFGSGSGGPH